MALLSAFLDLNSGVISKTKGKRVHLIVKDLNPHSSPKEHQLSSSQSSTNSRKLRTVTQEQINELHNAFSSSCGGNKEDYFGITYISSKFNIPADKLFSNVAFGGTDFGIDGYYYDKPNSTIHIFVFRWTENHMEFRDPLDKLGKKGIDKIFIDLSKSPEDPPMITFLKTDLFQNWKSIDKVVINFVFNGDPVNAEQSKVLSFLRETIEDKRELIEGYFSRVDQPDRLHNIIFQYVSNQRSLGHTTSSRDGVELSVQLGETLRISDNENEMMVALFPLDALHKMYNDLGERFFEKNIRSGLDDGSMTNKHIKKSLSRIISGEEPYQNFTLYHNGITLTAQRLDVDGDQLRMVEPRILNGAQTVKILKQFVDELQNGKQKGSDGTKEGKISENFSKMKIMTRIIRSKDDDFLKRITINNNRQNPIMPWNLRANDLIQMGFEELFAKLGIYYERRENAYRNLTDDDLEAVGTEKGVIEIRKFAQTLLAMQGQIDRISETKEVFENETWYSDTFKERYLQVDPRKFVLLYKIQFRFPTITREIRNVGAEKYSYVSKARNLLWCLAIQGILNDGKFLRYVENFGNSSGVEAALTDTLKTMATSKLRYILGETFEDKKYQSYIKEGRMSFLGTKAVFNDCMTTARARFSWEKTSL